MEHVYLGRQPIVDKSSNLVAYELLYRDKNIESSINNDRFASASVINSVLNKFGTKSVLGKYRGFIKIDEKFLMNDIIFSIPKEFFIFSLLDSVEMDERAVERIEQLYEKGYILSINDVILTQEKVSKYTEVLNKLSYFKIIIEKNSNAKTKDYVSQLKSNGIKVIATKVETDIGYTMAERFGCELFQGYFFAKPNIVENKKFDPLQLNVLKLYNMLIQDENIDDITNEFEQNHALTIQLLQFINSGAFHFRNKISSIHHILMLMGRQPLARWLMLMIYSKSTSKSDRALPLMLMVKNRTELMENILKAIDPKAKSNFIGEAYFVGVLSLTDTLFSMKLEDILNEMNITDDVKIALLEKKGILGEIYQLVCDMETFETKKISAFIDRHTIASHEIEEIIIKSMESVTEFESAIAS